MSSYLPNFVADGDQLVLESIDAQNARRAELRERISDLLGELGYEFEDANDARDTVTWIFEPDTTGLDLIDVCTWEARTLDELKHAWSQWHGGARCVYCALVPDRKIEDAAAWPACDMGQDHNWRPWMRDLNYGHCINCGSHGPAPAPARDGVLR